MCRSAASAYEVIGRCGPYGASHSAPTSGPIGPMDAGDAAEPAVATRRGRVDARPRPRRGRPRSRPPRARRGARSSSPRRTCRRRSAGGGRGTRRCRWRCPSSTRRRRRRGASPASASASRIIAASSTRPRVSSSPVGDAASATPTIAAAPRNDRPIEPPRPVQECRFRWAALPVTGSVPRLPSAWIGRGHLRCDDGRRTPRSGRVDVGRGVRRAHRGVGRGARAGRVA